MTAAAAPLATLRRLAERGATGEFICAVTEIEIHAYLQEGRIAWATSSAHPLEFARYIQQLGKVDRDTFRQVLDECRREKLPFGETLISWGLVSKEDVLAALRHQVWLALGALARLPVGPSIFLERRRFTEYSAALTLDLGSIDLATPPAAPAAASPTVLPVTAPTAASPGAPPAAAEDLALARRLLEVVRGAAWVEVRDGEQVVLALPGPSAGAPRVPPALAAATLADGADFVALRSEALTLAGVRTPSGASLWCGLSSDASYGGLVSALAALGVPRAPVAPTRTAPASRGAGGSTWSVGGHAPRTAAELALVLEFSRDVLAAVVLSPEGAPIAGLGKSPLDGATCIELLRRRLPVFAGAVPAPQREPEREPLGFGRRAAVAGEPGYWCFGAELLGELGQTLWVLTERNALQGLGWACLTALFRGLGRNEYLSEVRAS